MYRLALDHLKEWLASTSRNPLVIRGARQVGKTWLVREIARERGLTLIEVNFELEPSKKILFKENDPKKTLTALEVHVGQQIEIKNTLLFLDEIQAYPEMLAKLRWFKELMPELAVIATGSLLEFVLEKHDFSMPVGRISYYHLEPLSFEEYLYEKNQPLWRYIMEYHWEKVPETVHEKALNYLQEYIIVGGLPAAMQVWLECESFVAVQQVHHDILTTYRDDFGRYNKRYDVQIFEDVFNHIPKNVGQKIVYSHINNQSQSTTLKKIFTLISKARVIHPIKSTSGNGIPLKAEVNDKNIKAISLDVGLMNSLLGINLQDFKSIKDLELINKGAIAEQVVGQLLRTIHPYYIEPALYYWLRNKPGSNAEVDYLIQHHRAIIPIEVKAGTKGSMQSLHLFMKLKNLSTAVLLNTNMPGKMNVETKTSTNDIVKYQLLTVPIYMIGQLQRLLDCADSFPPAEKY